MTTAAPRSRRHFIGLGAALTVLLAPAPALAVPDREGYVPGLEGQVGVATSYVSSHSQYDDETGGDAGDTHESFRGADEGSSSSQVSRNYDTQTHHGPFAMPGGDCLPYGCIDMQSRAYGRVDVAGGVLQTFAGGYAAIGGLSGHSVAVDGLSRARLDDTVTLSKAGRVRLVGRVVGRLDASRTLPGSGHNARLALDMQFAAAPADCEYSCSEIKQGYAGSWVLDDNGAGQTGSAVDEEFAVEVDLPAGRTAFNARLDGEVSVRGDDNPELDTRQGVAATADGAGGPSTQRVVFAIEVLDPGVTATSGSGELPIVGGDATAPVLEVPSRIDADATSPAGAKVTYTATATDDSGEPPTVLCSPPSGATFKIGDTTVACTATDKRGNQGRATFVVHVAGGPEQLAKFIDVFSGLHRVPVGMRRYVREIVPRLYATDPCDTVDRMGQTVVAFRLAGILTRDQAADLFERLHRIGRASGC